MPSPLDFWLDRQSPISIDEKCSVAVDLFRGATPPLVLPVRDIAGTVIALLEREYFLGSFAQQYAWSLLSGRSLRQWFSLRSVSSAPEFINQQMSPTEVAQRLSRSSAAVTTMVMLDDAGRYVGLIHQRALLMGMLTEVGHARDEALIASEAKTLFLSTMSHELRTPLNGVIGLSDILLLERLTPAQHELCALIKGSGQRLHDLVSKILDYTALESGDVKISAHPFVLAEAVDLTVKEITPEARQKRLELVFHVDPHLPRTVIGDDVRLRQVLVQLVGNAVKFTSQGKVSVMVGKAGSGLVHFEVSDTGPGIDEQTSARLFQPFVQADSSMSRSYEGSGLGLAISQRLVGCMGGRIQVQSKEGRGSRFHFDVPLPAA